MDSIVFYRWLHFIHLALAATWVAAAVRADAALTGLRKVTGVDERRSRWRVSRRFSLMGEMPLVALMLVLGGMMSGMNGALVWKQPWFHAKLTFVTLLIVCYVLGSMRQRSIGSALDEGQEKQLTARLGQYRWIRFAMILCALGLMASVTVVRWTP